MRRLVLIILVGFLAVQTRAQSDPEYMMEIGGGVGLMGEVADGYAVDIVHGNLYDRAVAALCIDLY